MEGKTPIIIPQLREHVDDFLMEAFAANSQKLGGQGKQDNAKVRPTRDIYLSPNQIHPRSAGKRKKKAGNHPEATYDPFEKVDRKKQVALVEYVKTDLDNPIESSSPEVDFYLTLMTPKKQWVIDEYGWLSDMHMVVGMSIWSLRSPCPNRNERIAFLDPQFTSLWCMQYINNYLGLEKTWKFPIGFEKHYNVLGRSFTGINDTNVGDIRLKYAAEMKNEVALSDFVKMTSPYPRGTSDDDRSGRQIDSLDSL
ncbi:unnamed protein product [Microthlaspi erraticum]|uniref:Ubiquitin-like protease family profile domain-containing protein n=1 Tax=Microthlaspi erraticum TaxID=1685480 RepID=A0A6D2JQ90_9BRAS|nr:unnamed protein product [Microthlaspi erraticum]